MLGIQIRHSTKSDQFKWMFRLYVHAGKLRMPTGDFLRIRVAYTVEYELMSAAWRVKNVQA